MAKKQYRIRRGVIEDLPAIRRLNAALFDEEFRIGHDDALDIRWPDGDIGKEYYRLALTDQRKIVFIAEDDENNAVGYVIGTKSGSKFSYRSVKMGELENMYIVPEVRNQGVGKQLIIELVQWMKTEAIGRIYVNAYAKNSDAIRFYRKMGFEPIDVGLEYKI